MSPRPTHTGETDTDPTSPAVKAEMRASLQQTNAVNHAAKIARMEAPASQGFAGGVPEKIDEGDEPD